MNISLENFQLQSAQWSEHFQPQSTQWIIAVLIVLVGIYSYASSSKIPQINGKGFFEFSNKRAIKLYQFNATNLIGGWFRDHPNTPGMLNTEFGSMVILPGSMAEELRNDERFNLRQQLAKSFPSHLAGFEIFRDDINNELVRTVIIKHFNKQLVKITKPLAEETTLALADLFTDEREWHDVPLQATVLQLVSRMSSRVFLGPELCSNKEWLRLTGGYANVITKAFQGLQRWPAWMRYFVNIFDANCRTARGYMAGIRKLLRTILVERQRLKEEAIAKGKPVPEYNDAIEWVAQESNGQKYDPELIQLSMATFSVHTTTDLMTHVLADLALHPEIIQPLREEAISVLRESGWKKASLDQMILLDSVIKESQRMKPFTTVSMSRLATQRIVLSDGTVIPKGMVIAVDASSMWDPKLHDRPDKWDPYRFYNLRKGTKEQQRYAGFVSTAPEHLAFGYGKFACPGRFFTANELKIALINILLKYDIKFADGVTPRFIRYGIQGITDMTVKLSIRRRKEEIPV
ncbi:cytochrome P450 [Trichoderma harzianum]|uniref:Cytochrome P450 n=1 Tax=Trichoderma harzianum TaxID=5544 RepID=A0A0F9WTP3_TRIHA|nr:cytochrome P450 [Trichoderma harzianum]